jgi:hypothetical protein
MITWAAHDSWTHCQENIRSNYGWMLNRIELTKFGELVYHHKNSVVYVREGQTFLHCKTNKKLIFGW